ncbi:oligosaccharide flippase family protein [Vibrio sp. TBV020]|uniref:oligosaccharide flippase family protein n=1 Tax=Vibrio sp. TBV020 TaxID=3137398 RepID=UPI0038CD6C5C
MKHLLQLFRYVFFDAHYFVAASGQLIGKALSVGMGVLIARSLGPEQFGQYSFYLALASMGILFISLGLPTFATKQSAIFSKPLQPARLKGVVVWGTLWVVALFLLLLICASVVLALYIEHVDELLMPFVIICIVTISKAISNVYGGVLIGLNHPFQATLGPFIIYPSICIFFTLIYSYCVPNLNANSMLMGSGIAALFAATSSALVLRQCLQNKVKNVQPKLEPLGWTKQLGPFATIMILSTLNTELGGVLLGFLAPPEELGFYKVAIQAITVITLIFSTSASVYSPKIAQLYSDNNYADTQKVLTHSANHAFLCSLPVVIVFYFFGSDLLAFLFGDVYTKAYAMLLILLVGQVVRICMGNVGPALHMTGHEKQSVLVLAITVLVLFVTLVAFIPRWYGVGAAWAVTFSTITWSGGMAIVLFRKTGLVACIKPNFLALGRRV